MENVLFTKELHQLLLHLSMSKKSRKIKVSRLCLSPMMVSCQWSGGAGLCELQSTALLRPAVKMLSNSPED